MTISLRVVLCCLGWVASTLAFAHADHGRPQYGGVVAEAGLFQAELVAKRDVLTIYLSNHEEKVDSTSAGAKLTLIIGASKVQVGLAPAGDNKLEAKGNFDLPKGSKVDAQITLPGKPARSVSFEIQ